MFLDPAGGVSLEQSQSPLPLAWPSCPHGSLAPVGSETHAKKPSKKGESMEGTWERPLVGTLKPFLWGSPLGLQHGSGLQGLVTSQAWASWVAPGLQRAGRRGGTLTGGQQRAPEQVKRPGGLPCRPLPKPPCHSLSSCSEQPEEPESKQALRE